ncbi:hypothetical protein C0993_012733, partial [Termitomyces sp. T159_Od127]
APMRRVLLIPTRARLPLRTLPTRLLRAVLPLLLAPPRAQAPCTPPLPTRTPPAAPRPLLPLPPAPTPTLPLPPRRLTRRPSRMLASWALPVSWPWLDLLLP